MVKTVNFVFKIEEITKLICKLNLREFVKINDVIIYFTISKQYSIS